MRTGGAPDANEEYLIYQTLVGACPIGPDRLAAYLEKALREAKRNTSWIEQDHDWEERVKRFAVALLDHRPFLDDFGPGVCAYLRGGEVLAVVLVRPAGAAVLRGVAGRWRDVLTGEERDLGDEAAVADVLDASGLALLERA